MIILFNGLGRGKGRRKSILQLVLQRKKLQFPQAAKPFFWQKHWRYYTGIIYHILGVPDLQAVVNFQGQQGNKLHFCQRKTVTTLLSVKWSMETEQPQMSFRTFRNPQKARMCQVEIGEETDCTLRSLI